MINAIQNLVEADVHVANYSMGSKRGTTVYTAGEIYLDYIIRANRFTLVTAVGNTHDTIISPALAYNVITVGGFYNNETIDISDDVMYGGSCYDNLTGCEKPDFIAEQATLFREEDGKTVTGTSYAAPFVTGVIALLYELRPTLKTQPETVKAILMASCHRKVNPSEGDPVENMSNGLTEHQGAGTIDPYRAIAIAGSGNYGVRNLDSSAGAELIRIKQPAYGSTGLNVSIAWSVDNPSNNVAGDKINLDLRLLNSNGLLGQSTNTNSSTEMVYVTPSATSSDYMINIVKESDNEYTDSIRYAYAFSVDKTRYQYTDTNEGIFFLRNKGSSQYGTLSGTSLLQSTFSGNATQQWLISDNTVKALSTEKNRLSIGDLIGSSTKYRNAITNNSDGATINILQNGANGDLDGSVSIYNPEYSSALSIYSNTTNLNAPITWYPLNSSNEFHKWYLETAAYQKGDVDMDGSVTFTDSNTILQYTVNNITFSDAQEFLGDVNGDGEITAVDSNLVLQIVTNQI